VISEIISAKKQITPETALGLGAAFGTSAEMWLNMEAKYRLRLAQRSNVDEAVERRSRIYSAVPVKELVRRGWIGDPDDVQTLETSVKSFLGISSLDQEPPLALAARRTLTKAPDLRGVRAWMCRVEQLAAVQDVSAFSRARLKETVPSLLELTTNPGRILEAPGMLRQLGVRFVLVPHLPGTYLDGAVFAENGNPIVALTLRYDRLDNFWFTLIHELAHLVQGHDGNRPEYLDADAGNDPDENEADRLAAEWLVPGDALAVFVEKIKPYFSRQAIGNFAKSIGRHPAIVLGRLQHDGHVFPAHLRSSIPKVRRLLEPWIDVPEPVYNVAETIATAVRESAAPYDPEGAVVKWLRTNPGWHSPAEIKFALSLDRSNWICAIRILLESARVEREGQKRGTKYRVSPREMGE
jgi:HTH-type transcriptional regulator/antitoxin HigA